MEQEYLVYQDSQSLLYTTFSITFGKVGRIDIGR